MSESSRQNDPQDSGTAPRSYYGKYAGIVTDNGPPETGAHRGELTVQVAGILEETADGSGSQPIIVRAAPAFLPGFFFVPQEKDTVWVEFVGGDINSPIWTGVWYPTDRTPQTADDGAPTLDQKVVRTKSGHVLQFDDTSGSEKLVIKDATNKNEIKLDASGVTISATTALTLSVASNGGPATTLTIDGSGITATCGQSSLELTSDAITLSRPAVTLKVSSTVDVS